MGKLSASILAADLARLGEEVKLVEPYAEVIHVDIMDGHFVPPIALGAVVVRSLRPVTERLLHGHLMVDAPEGYFDELREAGLDRVSFHLEAVPDPGPAIRKARDAGLGVGLTLNLETSLEAATPYLEEIDDLMLMSIRPGWSFQQLNPEVYPRLEAARAQIDVRNPAVDSGRGGTHPRRDRGGRTGPTDRKGSLRCRRRSWWWTTIRTSHDSSR
ncbi:MAG: ribulose-phosphate 3-epimerase [Actinobacteria bacterium]|nr:MAG: ribulose-phosphate 3-epimerase [Actinomycetota bacterium]